jgi:hypothetical protein
MKKNEITRDEWLAIQRENPREAARIALDRAGFKIVNAPPPEQAPIALDDARITRGEFEAMTDAQRRAAIKAGKQIVNNHRAE